MNLYDLSQYEKIVLWGCGNDAKWYAGQFRVDYVVDKDKTKIGSKLKDIEIKPISDLVMEAASKSILVVITSTKYEKEIRREIENLGINVEITELSVMKAIWDCQNTSFALWGYDILIKDLLIRGGYDYKNMSYIEIGACHPILGSNTYNAYLTGARGVLVEPNPDLQSKLQKYRSGDICLMEGIGGKRDTLVYYKFNNEFRNTFDKLEAEDAIRKGFISTGTVKLEVGLLEELIENNNIDTSQTFLSIQAMGLEKEILESFDYKKYNFPLIALAYYSEEIFQFSIFQEYKCIAQVPRHVVLVNDEIYHKILG